MITPKTINDTKVIFGPVRLAYLHVFEKYKGEGEPGEGKYSATPLIPKTEEETIKAIKDAIEAAKTEGVTSKWGGKLPKKIDSCLRDGDEDDKGEEFERHFFLNAKSSRRVGVVNRDMEPITDPEDVYSGCYAIVSVSFYPYSKNGNNGVAASLENVMKYKDGDRFGGGGASAESDFGDLGIDAEGDDNDL